MNVNPRDLSKDELEKLSRAFIRAIAKNIGPNIDVPAPDVNTTPEIMGWMVDEYAQITGESQPAVITGKPISIGGSQGRTAATGRGGLFALLEYAKVKGIDPKESSVVVQGFGNVGFWFAKLAKEVGFKVLAVSGSKGGIYNKEGLDIDALMEHKKSTGKLEDFDGAEPISNVDLLELECDVLVPSALENQLTEDNASNIKAKVILELANGPTTPEADAIFYKNKIDVIPDVLANSGGVAVSYLEWVQNRQGNYWTEEEVNDKLSKLMTSAFNAVWDKSQEKSVTMRQAAFLVALRLIEYAELARV